MEPMSQHMRKPGGYSRAIMAVFWIFGIVLLQGIAAALWAQELTLPENPLRGRFVFEQKGCINCHAIKGEGGEIGPDLGQKKYYGSFLDLAGIMWNHAPKMLKRMRELELPYPEFTRQEMVELTAYLYYQRYLGEPGDLYRGKVLLQKKGCLTCHSIAGRGGKLGPAFDRLAKYVSPLYLAQALWNHGPKMEQELRRRGLKRPKFEPGEIVDLAAYIRSASRGKIRERVYLAPGNPKRGRMVFEEKGCSNCHATEAGKESTGPNLQKVSLNYSVTEIAGLMWNHGSAMAELMEVNQIQWPKLSAKEMADLIAYLYFLKFRGSPGNAELGRQIFAAKGCSKCHGENGRGGDIGPDLAESQAAASPIQIAQVMWNHAPVMEERVTEMGIEWPQLSGEEMSHLYAFLKSLVTTHNR